MPILHLLNESLNWEAQEPVVYQALLVIPMLHEAGQAPNYINADDFQLSLGSHILIRRLMTLNTAVNTRT